MITVNWNRNLYKAFGLTFSSEIILPELQRVVESDSFQVSIKVKDLAVQWDEVSEPNRYFTVKEDFCMFKIPNVAIYKVEKGKIITVSPIGGAKEGQIRLYLLGTCMGALLLQRRVLPLHGSAIEVDGKAYAIVGNSGAGKSTLASAFLQKGYRLITDDVIPVTLTNEDYPIITPSYPQQKLWVESLNEFRMETTNFRPIIDREDKYAIPVQHQFASDIVPLAGIFELTKGEVESVKLTPIPQLEGLHKLFYHTYRNFIVSRSGLMEWHFNMTVEIAKHIKLYQICRPNARFTAFDIVDMILEKVNKRGVLYDANHF